MLIEYVVRAANAGKKFKLKDDFKFVEFNDITAEGIQEDSPVPDQIEIWAAVEIYYDGEVPESYKVLNLMIGDWVEKNEEKLNTIINEELQRHFKEHYPNADFDLEEDDTAIWLDQLDYMPRIDAGPNSIIIEVELVMEAEPLEYPDVD
mgnify:CR=1 FL=1